MKSLWNKLKEKRKELTKTEKRLEGNVIIYIENIRSHYVIFTGNTINGVKSMLLQCSSKLRALPVNHIELLSQIFTSKFREFCAVGE